MQQEDFPALRQFGVKFDHGVTVSGARVDGCQCIFRCQCAATTMCHNARIWPGFHVYSIRNPL
ncbi:hypothetical protein SRABI106_04083 [Rahnella aquatilis]|nr:hypothetical protein SRABI106_04083 [Rahnella aquatilis]